MLPFDRRRARATPAVFTSDDLDRDLTALMQDPMYWRERDKDFHDHVTRQFQRVHGPEGPAPDGAGKRRGTLEVPRLRRRPGDDRIAQPVGRDAPNKPGDVAKLQRTLSETSDYAFTAPRERSGVMSTGLDTALTRFQTRTGLKPDGYAAPEGPTVQQIAAEAQSSEQAEDVLPETTTKPGSAEAQVKNEEIKQPETEVDEAAEETQTKCTHLKELIDTYKKNVADYTFRLNKAKSKLNLIVDEMQNLTSSREAIVEMGVDAYAAALALRLGLPGIVAYTVYKGQKIMNFRETVERLQSAKREQEALMNQAQRELKQHQAYLDNARESYEAQCGRP